MIINYIPGSFLAHDGTKGMKWYRRLFQNPDGTYTELGKARRRAAYRKAHRDERAAKRYKQKQLREEARSARRISKQQRRINELENKAKIRDLKRQAREDSRNRRQDRIAAKRAEEAAEEKRLIEQLQSRKTLMELDRAISGMNEKEARTKGKGAELVETLLITAGTAAATTLVNKGFEMLTDRVIRSVDKDAAAKYQLDRLRRDKDLAQTQKDLQKILTGRKSTQEAMSNLADEYNIRVLQEAMRNPVDVSKAPSLLNLKEKKD